MDNILIRLEGVTKVYEGWRSALKNIDLEIEKGELVFMVGPNGAGKTTLLKLIRMEEKPTSGRVFIDGYNSMEKDDKRVAELRRKMGLVFEDLKLLPGRTLEENLFFPLSVAGKNERYIQSRITEILGAFNLYSKRRLLPEKLSFGERKKLAIARAVINDPLLILGDEPFGGLDERFSSEVIDFFKKINYRGCTILLVTHRADLVKDFRGRILYLENGEIRR